MTDSRSYLARIMPDAFSVFFTGRQPYKGQAAVMPEVVRGNNVLFAAPTASGKTEAAIAPLFQRHVSFGRQDLSTVYVAPTKALVNDLYERLIGYLGARQPGAIARYTGDRHEIRAASGVFCLVTTPEALDSLQLRRPELLKGVRAIVVDEIHLLHGQPRGQQLRHVIARIDSAATTPNSPRERFQVIGMTATLEDMGSVAKIWLGDNAKILSDGVPRDIDLQLINLDTHGEVAAQRARALSGWLNKAGAEKVLVFANSRNSAHALAAKLHQELVGTRWPVHLHFGALAALERERVEHEMRKNPYGVCVATSTLEIGIDIGDINAVVLCDPPRSVSAFLQRIGRGNRRSDICRVVAFRASDDDERLIRALLDCAQRGELDDIHEYDRASVRFQQVLSLAWRATRQDRPLSLAALCAEADAPTHEPVVHDMIDTGSLVNIRGALIPCDRLMDQADGGQIHTVIANRTANSVVDIKTGHAAILDADETTAGGAIFHGGEMRRLLLAPEGGAFLGGTAPSTQPLARIKGVGPASPFSRSVIWGLARQQGFDPTRWQLDGRELVTWGGEIFNTLLAALFSRQAPKLRFVPGAEAIRGPVAALDVSISSVRELASVMEGTASLPLNIASKFTNGSRYLTELSNELAAKEKRQSVPWAPFGRWLRGINGIDVVG